VPFWRPNQGAIIDIAGIGACRGLLLSTLPTVAEDYSVLWSWDDEDHVCNSYILVVPMDIRPGNHGLHLKPGARLTAAQPHRRLSPVVEEI
jgi:hypothetical protein